MDRSITISNLNMQQESGTNGSQKRIAGELDMESQELLEKLRKGSAQSQQNAPSTTTAPEPLKTVAIASVSSVVQTVLPLEPQVALPLPLGPLDSNELIRQPLKTSMVLRRFGLRKPAELLPRNVMVKDYLIDGMFCEGYACAGKCYRSAPCSEPIWEARERIKNQMEAIYESRRKARESAQNT